MDSYLVRLHLHGFIMPRKEHSLERIRAPRSLRLNLFFNFIPINPQLNIPRMENFLRHFFGRNHITFLVKIIYLQKSCNVLPSFIDWIVGMLGIVAYDDALNIIHQGFEPSYQPLLEV